MRAYPPPPARLIKNESERRARGSARVGRRKIDGRRETKRWTGAERAECIAVLAVPASSSRVQGPRVGEPTIA